VRGEWHELVGNDNLYSCSMWPNLFGLYQEEEIEVIPRAFEKLVG
jgi:hypothetical protein